MNLKRKGQSLVEFSLILPILMLLLLGIIEGAHIIQAYISAQNASRQAARYAVSGQPLSPSGDPDWPSQADLTRQGQRAQSIKRIAIDASRGTGYTRVISTNNQFDEYYYDKCDTGSDAVCAGVLAVEVEGQGQDLNDVLEYQPDYPGLQGLNIKVNVYHNVQIWDPIYAAIAPGGFVRVRASTVMQNEGVDVTLSGEIPVPEENDNGSPGTGDQQPQPTTPNIEFFGTNEVQVGETYDIQLRYHPPSTSFDICFASQLIQTVNVDGTGNALIDDYTIPPLALGFYPLRTVPVGAGCGSTPVANNSVAVGKSNLAVIYINNSTSEIWPFGSPLEYRLSQHNPSKDYNVELVKPGNAVQPLTTMTTDAIGEAGPELYQITDTVSGTYIFQSKDAVQSTIVATQPVRFVEGCIQIDQQACNQPVTVPDQASISISLREHAYAHGYRIVFDPGGIYEQEIIAEAVTDGLGKILGIPFNLPVLPSGGSYTIASYDGPYQIAVTQVTINTPTTPFIAVANGYKWPAGTKITFQLRNHDPSERYDIYWEGTRVITNVNQYTDINGNLWMSYTIPPDTVSGTYDLTSKLAVAAGGSLNGPTVADTLQPIQVTGAPYLEIKEGNPQVPGATITVLLGNHAINTDYDLYINGNQTKLPKSPVGTNSNGEGSLQYSIPLNMAVGQTYEIRSYLKGNTSDIVATTNLILLAPDLRITAIEAPPNPPLNKPMVLTITVQNNSAVTITHQSYDVDLYIDPPTEPNLGRSLPPGDVKAWLQPPMAMNSTKTFTTQVTIYGEYLHELWGRVDTSNRIIETIENNNLFLRTIEPNSCQFEFRLGSNNSSTLSGTLSPKKYGDANSDLTINGTSGLITMNNRGSSAYAQHDDNGDADEGTSGYMFGYHQLEGDFDVQVRLDSQVRTSGPQGIDPLAAYGLEVRANLSPTADKLLWMKSQSQGLLWLSRQSNGMDILTNPNDIQTASTSLWLRVVKVGTKFTLYYADTNSATAPTDWTPQQTLTINGLGSSVYLGVMNTPHNTANQKMTATFSNYRVCSNSGSSCGPVREAGQQVIVDAANFVENIASGGKKWGGITSNGQIGMVVPDAGSTFTTPNAPQMRYEVDITNPGAYRVWFLSKKPNVNGNTLYFGLTNGTPQLWTSTLADNTLGWFGGSASEVVNFTQVGRQSLSLWANKDGMQVYKILLTQNATYNPNNETDPTHLQQSACAESGVPPSPPGLQQCEAVIVNGDFEDDALMSKWIYSSIGQQVTRTSVPHWLGPNQSFSMLLPDTNIAGLARSPWLYQTFQMPTWVMTPTLTSINVKMHVGINPQGTDEADELYVGLRDSSGGMTVTTPFTVATGKDKPTLNPTVPSNNNWLLKQIDLAKGFNPATNLLNYRGQEVSLYFHAPNAGSDSTIFYLDNVELEVCNTEPRPDQYTTEVSGSLRVLIDGIPTAKEGVFVWAYAIDGTMKKTYTIQDSTFSFYNLPATSSGTTYVIYAEYAEDGEYYSASTIISLKSGQAIKNLSLLLF